MSLETRAPAGGWWWHHCPWSTALADRQHIICQLRVNNDIPPPFWGRHHALVRRYWHQVHEQAGSHWLLWTNRSSLLAHLNQGTEGRTTNAQETVNRETYLTIKVSYNIKRYLSKDNIDCPQRLQNLPSIKQGIRWMHAACGYPVKSTWIKAIHKENYIGWPLLTVKSFHKHYPETEQMLDSQSQSKSLFLKPLTTNSSNS